MMPLPPLGKDKDYFPVYFKVNLEKRRFNCWGFVARVAGWIDDFRWISDYEMMELLQSNTEQVTEPQDGDIVAFFYNSDPNFLSHTAIYRGNDLVLHKMGAAPIFEHPLEYAKQSYGNKTTFHRIKKNLTTEKPVVA
jgi:hypothetical protein